MRFTEERLSHLAHLIEKSLVTQQIAGPSEEGLLLRQIKKGLSEYLKLDEEIDSLVRQKISSQKRGIYEGSPEWEVLYRKYFEEEIEKKRL